MRVEPVVSVQDHARERVAEIREVMARAGRFRALPGRAGVGMGLIAVVAAVWSGGAPSVDWVRVWLVAAGLAAPLGAWSMLRAAQAASVDLATGVARRFVLALFVPLAAGGILTVAALQRTAYDLLPTVWLALYGTALLVAGAVSTRLITGMGLAFLLLAAVAALGPATWSGALLGIGFGGVHLAGGTSLLMQRARQEHGS